MILSIVLLVLALTKTESVDPISSGTVITMSVAEFTTAVITAYEAGTISAATFEAAKVTAVAASSKGYVLIPVCGSSPAAATLCVVGVAAGVYILNVYYQPVILPWTRSGYYPCCDQQTGGSCTLPSTEILWSTCTGYQYYIEPNPTRTTENMWDSVHNHAVNIVATYTLRTGISEDQLAKYARRYHRKDGILPYAIDPIVRACYAESRSAFATCMEQRLVNDGIPYTLTSARQE